MRSLHLSFAHAFFQEMLVAGDLAVDATCGNGKDTQLLASLVGPTGHVVAYDLQAQALQIAKTFLEKSLAPEIFQQITFRQRCHSRFCTDILPGSVKLFVYNLGYLPGGNKQCTTLPATTLASLQHASELLHPSGGVALTCYVGHPGGLEEQQAVLKWIETLSPKQWEIFQQQPERPTAPRLITLKRRFS